MGRGITRACGYYGGGGGRGQPQEDEDSLVPPEAGHRHVKELSNNPKAVYQRRKEKDRSQRRRDALKRLEVAGGNVRRIRQWL
jgi:hypothetical protein